MKKFKVGDTIRLKADTVTKRTYEVIPGPAGTPMAGISYGIRNDGVSAYMPTPFVLGRPEEYKLVHRPTKKDREIKQLKQLVKEAQNALSSSQRRNRENEQLADLKLLDAGLVRLDLLRTHTISSPQLSGDGSHTYFEVKMLVEGQAINEIVRAWSH